MHASHHLTLVLLSLAVAVLGSWTALDLFRRVRTHVGRGKRVWLATAALAMGLSIWSMHFIAMLGFDPGSAVRYDPFLTLVSLALAVGATGGAFFFVAPEHARLPRVLVAGAAMGAGICLMHYTGMAALRTATSLGYDPTLVALSLVVAVVASVAALLAARRERSSGWRAIAAVTLGVAIVGMHYTAMSALKLTPMTGVAHAPSGAPPFALAISVAGGTLFILVLALMASLYDQRANILSALEAGGVGYWELDLYSRSFHISPRGKEILGLKANDELTHEQFLGLLSPEARARRDQVYENTLRTGADYDAEYRLTGNGRWVNLRGQPMNDGGGRPRRLIGVVLDVTDRHEAFAAVSESERRQRLLIDELNHRVKNTLATIQSIAAQTAKRAVTTDEFRKSFEARLIALSSTHNALTRGGWEMASLRELFDHEMKPYAEEQIRLRGADVQLGAKQTLALGMVLHELATNAAKYGALSSPDGTLDVAWAVEPGEGSDLLRIEWSEVGGPLVAAPARKGFGSRLIQASIEQELGGAAALRYEADGFKCSLSIPLTRCPSSGVEVDRLAFGKARQA